MKNKVLHLSTGFSIEFLRPRERDLMRLFVSGPRGGYRCRLTFRSEDVQKIIDFFQGAPVAQEFDHIHLSSGYTLMFHVPSDQTLFAFSVLGPSGGHKGHPFRFRDEDIPNIIDSLEDCD